MSDERIALADTAFAPCGCEPPQSASQLHGVCLFCMRNRLGDAARLLRESVEREERLYSQREAAAYKRGVEAAAKFHKLTHTDSCRCRRCREVERIRALIRE